MCLAIPAKIVELFPTEERRAIVDVGGVRRQIETGLLDDDPPREGDWVLIHVGFAMTKISEEQALDQLEALALLGEQEAALEEVSGYASGESGNEDKQGST
jgi:hydrogenase expression/formation protein HypC